MLKNFKIEDSRIVNANKVSNLNQTVSQALKNTKIEFIKGKYGEQFKNPLFWAPYVYVGI